MTIAEVEAEAAVETGCVRVELVRNRYSQTPVKPGEAHFTRSCLDDDAKRCYNFTTQPRVLEQQQQQQQQQQQRQQQQ